MAAQSAECLAAVWVEMMAGKMVGPSDLQWAGPWVERKVAMRVATWAENWVELSVVHLAA
jgi:hypothetical protein